MAVAMTMRQRLLAVVRGEAVDRVPFVQYHDLAAPDAQVWSVVGRQELGILQWTMPWRRQPQACRMTTEPIARAGLEGLRTTIHTPVGTLREERFYEPVYRSAWIAEHFVKEPADYEVLTAWLDDQVIVPEPATLAEVRRSLGCIAAIDRRQRDVFRLVAAMDVDDVDIPDNLTAPVIGEAYFRRYCLPACDELAALMGDRPVFVHMDGDLAPLAEAIAGSGVRGIDFSENVPPFAWRTSFPAIARAICHFRADHSADTGQLQRRTGPRRGARAIRDAHA